MRPAGSRAAARLIAVVAVALSLGLPASAAADVAQVTVVAPGGSQQTLSLEALAGSEDVVDRPYVLRSAAGETTQTVTGFSLAAILDAAGADPYGFSYLEVQRPAGGAVQLSRQQALDPGAFADGPPVVYTAATGTGFLRPAGEGDDLNAGDSFEAPQGISLVLRKGSPLQVKAQASPLRTRPEKPVHFSAIVERAGSGEALTYSWYFDDGHSANTAEATHSFAERGSYDVVVGVTASGNETGASAVVTIQVGAPLGGPDRKGGGENEDAEAADHGAATGTSTGTGGSGGSTGLPAQVPFPAPEEAVPTPDPGQPRPEPAPQPASEPPGEQIEGELLNASAATPAPPEEQVAARSGNPDGDGGSGGGVPGTALGVLATLGLLGTGALVEARGLAGLRPRRGIA